MATLTSIAHDVGLSVAAVSHIVNGKGNYAEATRKRVLARAAEVGYRPNLAARAARTQRFQCLSLLSIAPEWKGRLDQHTLNGCVVGCQEAGYRLQVGLADADNIRSLTSNDALLREQSCDALLLHHLVPPETSLLRAVVACQVPTLWMNLRIDHPCVHPDDRGGMIGVVEHLRELGYKRPAFADLWHTRDLPLQGAHYSANDRREAFLETLCALGSRGHLLVPDRRSDFDQEVAFIRAALRATPRPDVVVTYGTRECEVIFVVAQELGLRIPEDLGLVQFHYVASTSDHRERRIDTALIPAREVGRIAANELIARVEGQPVLAAKCARAVPYTWSWGATTRPQ